MSNLFSENTNIGPDDELEEDWTEDGYDEDEDVDWQEEDNSAYQVNPQSELFVQYGTEIITVPVESTEGKNIAAVFEEYKDDLMISRDISQLNIRSGGQFIDHSSVPQAGTIYVATVSVDSKG